MNAIQNIFLSIDKQSLSEIDYARENTDVIVEMLNGETFVASFFTYQNLEVLRSQHEKRGCFLNGKYFWAEHILLIDNITEKNVRLVVNDLIEEGNFHIAFRKII